MPYDIRKVPSQNIIVTLIKENMACFHNIIQAGLAKALKIRVSKFNQIPPKTTALHFDTIRPPLGVPLILVLLG